MKRDKRLWWALKGASETRRTNGNAEIDQVPQFRETNPGTPERRTAIRSFQRGVDAATAQMTKEKKEAQDATAPADKHTNHAELAVQISYEDARERIQAISDKLAKIAARGDNTVWPDASVMKAAAEALHRIESDLNGEFAPVARIEDRMEDTAARISGAVLKIKNLAEGGAR